MHTNMRQPRSIVVSAVVASCILITGCASNAASIPDTFIRIDSGGRAAFHDVRCLAAIEMFEQRSRLRSSIEAEVRTRLELPACDRANNDLGLDIVYQAGPGVCIDCVETPDGWSGFAFIVVSATGERERAGAEWHGSSASSGKQLRDAFIRDLLKLIR